MKIKFAGYEVDDALTISELAKILNLSSVQFTFITGTSKGPSAQEIIDSC